MFPHGGLQSPGITFTSQVAQQDVCVTFLKADFASIAPSMKQGIPVPNKSSNLEKHGLNESCSSEERRHSHK